MFLYKAGSETRVSASSGSGTTLYLPEDPAQTLATMEAEAQSILTTALREREAEEASRKKKAAKEATYTERVAEDVERFTSLVPKEDVNMFVLMPGLVQRSLMELVNLWGRWADRTKKFPNWLPSVKERQKVSHCIDVAASKLALAGRVVDLEPNLFLPPAWTIEFLGQLPAEPKVRIRLPERTPPETTTAEAAAQAQAILDSATPPKIEVEDVGNNRVQITITPTVEVPSEPPPIEQLVGEFTAILNPAFSPEAEKEAKPTSAELASTLTEVARKQMDSPSWDGTVDGRYVNPTNPLPSEKSTATTKKADTISQAEFDKLVAESIEGLKLEGNANTIRQCYHSIPGSETGRLPSGQPVASRKEEHPEEVAKEIADLDFAGVEKRIKEAVNQPEQAQDDSAVGRVAEAMQQAVVDDETREYFDKIEKGIQVVLKAQETSNQPNSGFSAIEKADRAARKVEEVINQPEQAQDNKSFFDFLAENGFEDFIPADVVHLRQVKGPLTSVTEELLRKAHRFGVAYGLGRKELSNKEIQEAAGDAIFSSSVTKETLEASLYRLQETVAPMLRRSLHENMPSNAVLSISLTAADDSHEVGVTLPVLVYGHGSYVTFHEVPGTRLGIYSRSGKTPVEPEPETDVSPLVEDLFCQVERWVSGCRRDLPTSLGGAGAISVQRWAKEFRDLEQLLQTSASQLAQTGGHSLAKSSFDELLIQYANKKLELYKILTEAMQPRDGEPKDASPQELAGLREEAFAKLASQMFKTPPPQEEKTTPNEEKEDMDVSPLIEELVGKIDAWVLHGVGWSPIELGVEGTIRVHRWIQERQFIGASLIALPQQLRQSGETDMWKPMRDGLAAKYRAKRKELYSIVEDVMKPCGDEPKDASPQEIAELRRKQFPEVASQMFKPETENASPQEERKEQITTVTCNAPVPGDQVAHEPLGLFRVTITGADNTTDIDWMIDMSRKYPFVEWGILLSRSQMGSPRFPGAKWLQRLVERNTILKVMNVHLSAHICGRWVRNICQGAWTPILGDESELPSPTSLFQLFERIQLNFHAELHKIDMEAFKKGLEMVDKEFAAPQFIFQLDGVNDDLLRHFETPVHHGVNVAPLYDLSGGRGLVPKEWLPSHKFLDTGYAGGLGPENLKEELERIAQVASGRIWIDMESRVRYPNNSGLDDYKVAQVLEHCSTLPYLAK